jgi:hypothetical protein
MKAAKSKAKKGKAKKSESGVKVKDLKPKKDAKGGKARAYIDYF